jgi:hypothetical protein
MNIVSDNRVDLNRIMLALSSASELKLGYKNEVRAGDLVKTRFYTIDKLSWKEKKDYVIGYPVYEKIINFMKENQDLLKGVEIEKLTSFQKNFGERIQSYPTGKFVSFFYYFFFPGAKIKRDSLIEIKDIVDQAILQKNQDMQNVKKLATPAPKRISSGKKKKLDNVSPPDGSDSKQKRVELNKVKSQEKKTPSTTPKGTPTPVRLNKKEKKKTASFKIKEGEVIENDVNILPPPPLPGDDGIPPPPPLLDVDSFDQGSRFLGEPDVPILLQKKRFDLSKVKDLENELKLIEDYIKEMEGVLNRIKNKVTDIKKKEEDLSVTEKDLSTLISGREKTEANYTKLNDDEKKNVPETEILLHNIKIIFYSKEEFKRKRKDNPKLEDRTLRSQAIQELSKTWNEKKEEYEREKKELTITKETLGKELKELKGKDGDVSFNEFEKIMNQKRDIFERAQRIRKQIQDKRSGGKSYSFRDISSKFKKEDNKDMVGEMKRTLSLNNLSKVFHDPEKQQK